MEIPPKIGGALHMKLVEIGVLLRTGGFLVKMRKVVAGKPKNPLTGLYGGHVSQKT